MQLYASCWLLKVKEYMLIRLTSRHADRVPYCRAHVFRLLASMEDVHDFIYIQDITESCA